MDLRIFKEILQSLGSKYVVFKDITEKNYCILLKWIFVTILQIIV